MGFLNFFKKTKNDVEPITELLPGIDGIEVIFIVKDNTLIYTKDNCDNLFSLDKDGDQKLNGRVVCIIYRGQSDKSVIEIFVAFPDEDTYALFTLQIRLQERLIAVSQSVYKSMLKLKKVFDIKEMYSTQFVYTFKMYKKGSRFFMVNNGQTTAYLVEKSCIKRGGADKIKSEFWGG